MTALGRNLSVADAPDWITAAATVVALGAALWAGFTATKLYNIERKRDADRDDAAERQQADLVAAWVSWTDQPNVAMTLPDDRTSRANLALQNASPVPVYDVEVEYSEGEEALGSQKFHVLSPTGPAPHHREIKSVGVGDLLARPRARDARVDIRVAIAFTDARGARWARTAHGQLAKINPRTSS